MSYGKLGEVRVVDNIAFTCTAEYGADGGAPASPEQWCGGPLRYAVVVFREAARPFRAGHRGRYATFEEAARGVIRDTKQDYLNAKALVAKFEGTT